jgi:ubiquinone/menaquinone biosynthesis C-methylase UbiE
MSSFFAQFGHPRGALGWAVGHLMAAKNGERSRWALSLLDAQPGEHVLEIGFGPGVDIRRLLATVGERGRVDGVDVSTEMVRQARARNRTAVADNRSRLEPASATALPFPDATFDAVYATNSAQFWPDLDAGMREVRRVLRRGGRALIVVQPMWRGATDADSDDWLARLLASMHTADFATATGVTRAMRPVTVVAASGTIAALSRHQ